MTEKEMKQEGVNDSGRIARLEEELRQERARHLEDVKLLTEKIEELTRLYEKALDENARLRSILDNNSGNSSLPPSTDQKTSRKEKAANEYNGREKSGRKAGGQKGHQGKTLTEAEVKEKLASGKYKYELVEIGEKKDGACTTRYELDLEIQPVIREIRIYADAEGKLEIPEQYYSAVTYGETIRALAVNLYGEGVLSNDRIAAFLNEASGVDFGLSEGSVYGFCSRFAEKSEGVIRELEKEQDRENVLCTDATCTRTNGKQSYIRNISSEGAVIYYAMKSKSIDELKKIAFLVRYRGILMHDHETALYHFGQGHAECNVHILRYLRKNQEDTGHEWSEKMIALLTEMNDRRKAMIAAGETEFSPELIQSYENQYRAILAEGREQNQKTEHEYARKKEAALLKRLEDYSENHLLFLHRFDVPFDDNMSERDLRKAKNRQKMAGGFRKPSGQEMYCKILTIIETAKRRKAGIITAIKNVLRGSPAVFQTV